MMIKYSVRIVSVVLLLFVISCNPAIKPEQLYGKWNYIKVEKPNANPPDSVTTAELEVQEPYIQFSKGNKLVIMWGGKVLSHGTFSLEGGNINYKETMPDGKIRGFPFWVSKLTGKELVFETKGEEGSRVTAVRE